MVSASVVITASARSSWLRSSLTRNSAPSRVRSSTNATGLVKKSSAPAASPATRASRSPTAVKMTTGISS